MDINCRAFVLRLLLHNSVKSHACANSWRHRRSAFYMTPDATKPIASGNRFCIRTEHSIKHNAQRLVPQCRPCGPGFCFDKTRDVLLGYGGRSLHHCQKTPAYRACFLGDALRETAKVAACCGESTGAALRAAESCWCVGAGVRFFA